MKEIPMCFCLVLIWWVSYNSIVSLQQESSNFYGGPRTQRNSGLQGKYYLRKSMTSREAIGSINDITSDHFTYMKSFYITINQF